MPPRRPAPAVEPLGYLAAGLGVLTLLLGLSYLLTPLALPPALLGTFLGLLCRGMEEARTLGNLALALCALGVGAGLLLVFSGAYG
ncbi:hypothetical protein [Nocardioides litoris]|uniref:hypothetical protein n=1 Tax=Nocardioides litoris TaxID=1926648 RepID=UPI00111CD0EB|nr:hypothetical protein [Nocardioides litoris]